MIFMSRDILAISLSSNQPVDQTPGSVLKYNGPVTRQLILLIYEWISVSADLQQTWQNHYEKCESLSEDQF